VSPADGQAALAAVCGVPCPEGGTRTAAPRPRRALAPAPRPLWIAAAGHTCLAWWHAPAGPAGGGALPLAVVLASSWGAEDVAAYAGLRALASALAEAGLGTLRFEWPDTGDSSAPTGTTSVADALAAFGAAAAQALALSGHARLAFVGAGLGALLAAHAAVARADVDALVALAPAAGGRAFVREQGAQDVRLPARAPAGAAHALFDAAELPVSLGGFAMPVRCIEALARLKWPSAATTSVLEALVLRSPASGARTAAEAFARMGVRVRERALEGPADAAIVRWLRERALDATVLRGVPSIENFGSADPANGAVHAALASARLESATAAVLALAAAEPPAWMRLRAGAVALRERVVLLQDGTAGALAGVLGERDADAAAGGRPPRRAIVLLSSGDDRRIGPRRAWVAWARHRAALGDVTLRLDLGGSGDSGASSAARACAGSGDARAVDDVARAVAWLRRELGVRDCTVVGAGPGAAHAWRVALAGVDVQRVVAIDPTDLCGRGADRPARAADGATRARRLLGRCSRGAGRLLQGRRRGEFAAAAARAGARGVALSLVCDSRERGLALVRRELGRRGLALVRERQVAVSQLAVADPAFAGLAGRDELCRRLDALVAPAVPAATASPRHGRRSGE
jgi:hypothetical protein